MDSSNLATLFAPNILHTVKPGCESMSTTEMATHAEERIEVINVVRSMIDHNKELFEVSDLFFSLFPPPTGIPNVINVCIVWNQVLTIK